MKGLHRNYSMPRADAFECFVGAFFRARGYEVEYLDPYLPGVPSPEVDRGDLMLTKNGKPPFVLDVKERDTVGWNPGYRDWTRYDTVGLTSIGQFHQEWAYAVVAPDFSVMGMVAPWLVPDSGFSCHRTENIQTNTMVCIHKRHFTVHRLNISGSPF